MTKIEDLTMHTIRAQVWKAIETDAAAKKDLSRNVINVRALAKYLLSEYKINATLEAVISSIRRYRRQPLAKGEATRVYSLLKQAKIRTLTKMASLALKKNEEVHQKIGALLPSINSTGGEVLRVMEGARIFKLIFDQKNMERMQLLFGKSNVVGEHTRLGMLELTYPPALEKTPGVFSVISGELGGHDISIIDALICGNEHIIVVDERKFLQAFDVVFSLCQS